jgi:integron integrase
MQGDRGGSTRSAGTAPRTGATVRLARRDGFLELRFLGRFTEGDVAAVKAIAGRKWDPRRGSWRLRDAGGTLDALHEAFGPRIVWRSGPGEGVEDRAPGTADGDAVKAPTVRADLSGEPKAILGRLRTAIRTREYSRKTEVAYVGWARRFLAFDAACPEGAIRAGGARVEAFLQHLAGERRLSARSRNQATSALSFMFREVLGSDELRDLPRARGPHRMPTVLTHGEVLGVLRQLSGKYLLIGALLYSAGLRIEECLKLRVKDIDFELRQIAVRDGKGRKDRFVPLAHRVAAPLEAQAVKVAEAHRKDREGGHGWAPLPGALHRKDPTAGYQLGWQFLFPARTPSQDPATGWKGRGPLHTTAAQREVKRAVRRSRINKRATCHTLRHSFATEALRSGCDIRTLQHVMGHKDVRTTMIYLHVVEHSGLHFRSPLDRPDDPEDIEAGPVGRPWLPTEAPRVSKPRPAGPPRD